jgi:uncharacterized membrane protein YphA (DoxX/SURF4 family)
MVGIFFVGATATWKHAKYVGPKAERFSGPISRATGIPVTGEHLVRVNSCVQLGAGTLFVLGVQQRLMALALIGSLVPTTIAGHAFWEIDDEAERRAQFLNFLKNGALIGGLVFAALDTGGRPSVFWSGRKAAEGIVASLAATAQDIDHGIKMAIDL